LIIDKKTIEKNETCAIELLENQEVGIVLKIMKIKKKNLIVLKILPATIKIEDLCFFYQIDVKSTSPKYIIFKNSLISTFFKLVDTGNIVYLVTKFKNFNK
jgi:hypothetical protein